MPGQKGDADLAGRRLAAWCRDCASGDWSLFGRRLERDGLSIGPVLARFATARRQASAAPPAWIHDAIWIEAALQNPAQGVEPLAAAVAAEPCAFEQLLAPLVERAEAQLWDGIDARSSGNLTESARACLRLLLLKQLSDFCSPVLYESFSKMRDAGRMPADATQRPPSGEPSTYVRFVGAMQAGGFRRLFDAKPVPLRLLAVLVRQWIETSREFVTRLDVDLSAIRRDILHSDAAGRVARIEGDRSDPHNGGRSVLVVTFEDGARVVYKPKDLRLDAAWHALVGRLNRDGPPIELKATHAIPRDGYGWTEFIDHVGCADAEGCRRFFRRAGAWLALFHSFAGTDIHQENMIADGEHPVPIDLEMILQASAVAQETGDGESRAFKAAMETVANSVVAVGLLPAYGKFPNNKVFATGGMTPDWVAKAKLGWKDINSDGMRPSKGTPAGGAIPNLPHVDGHYARLGDHIDEFVSAFEDYARFLLSLSRDAASEKLFDGFAGVPVRKVVRPTRFYYMLLQRLKDHRHMDDGITWSAQADFVARLADWEKESDPLWPLKHAERSALLALNVPHFVSPSDEAEIRDAAGIAVRIAATSGLERARARVRNFDARDLAWQVEVIRQVTGSASTSALRPATAEPRQSLPSDRAVASTRERFVREADEIAAELSRLAIRRGPGAAWIALDWLGDSEVSNLVAVGPDLYNGVCGIAVFLAAHAAVTGCKSSEELALAAVADLRQNLRSRNSARMARSLGLGGTNGLGSIVYALAVMAKCLDDDGLLADARAAAELVTDDLIAADKHLDVMGGSAGAILGLLRLHRDTRSDAVLERATRCGEHLLAQPRVGAPGCRSWGGHGAQAINGMSHGAAGFALALASLATAAGRNELAKVACECVAFENSSYDDAHKNWPDIRTDHVRAWQHKWCHGAPGIGLARIGTARRGGLDAELLARDVRNALACIESGEEERVDTLCCGTLASIEFLSEAAAALGRNDLRELASRRLTAVLELAASTGDYRWGVGSKRFHLGLFRGLAGVGYACLRQVDDSLPNVLIWD